MGPRQVVEIGLQPEKIMIDFKDKTEDCRKGPKLRLARSKSLPKKCTRSKDLWDFLGFIENSEIRDFRDFLEKCTRFFRVIYPSEIGPFRKT